MIFFVCFLDFLKFFWEYWIFRILSKLLRFLLKVIEVTTEHQKSPKMGLFFRRAKKALVKGQSHPQELEESPHRGLYFLVKPFIHLMSEWSFCSECSSHCPSQTVRAGELTFWENVHPPPCVTCHMSHVMCHMSRVTYRVSGVTCYFFSSFFHPPIFG